MSYQCAACGQVYWWRSHFGKITRKLDSILDTF